MLLSFVRVLLLSTVTSWHQPVCQAVIQKGKAEGGSLTATHSQPSLEALLVQPSQSGDGAIY